MPLAYLSKEFFQSDSSLNLDTLAFRDTTSQGTDETRFLVEGSTTGEELVQEVKVSRRIPSDSIVKNSETNFPAGVSARVLVDGPQFAIPAVFSASLMREA